jgi:cobalamin synthase
VQRHSGQALFRGPRPVPRTQTPAREILRRPVASIAILASYRYTQRREAHQPARPARALVRRYTPRVSSRDAWQRRLGPLYGGAVALVHSTPWRWPTEVGDDPRTAGWLVALGIPVGAVAWVVAALIAAAGLPPTIAALAGLAALSLASAALVERGLAERVDHWDGQLRSPGVAAVLVVVFVTLVRAAAITSLPPSKWLAVLVATAVVGRWSAMFVQALGDPITHDGSRRSLITLPAPAWLVAAISAGVAVVTVLAVGKAGILALALAAIAAFALGLEAQRRDGSLTSSAVATVAAVGELAVLLIATI